MLTDQQVEEILIACERATGSPLQGLRTRLLKQRDSLASLWELIVLYSSLNLGKILPENSDGEPDVTIRGEAGRTLYLEATFLTPRNQGHYERLQDFPRWISQRLKNVGVEWWYRAHFEMEPANKEQELEVPRKNVWPSLAKDQSFQDFCEAAGVQKTSVWTCPKGNLRVLATESTNPGSGWPVTDLPKKPQDHALYRAIKSKAKQARSWFTRGLLPAPLVVVVGTEDFANTIDTQRLDGVSSTQAIYAALIDQSKWSKIDVYNKIGSWPAGNLKVAGAKYISGVVFAKFKTSMSILPSGLKRKCTGDLVVNPHAENPLTNGQQTLVCGLELNGVKYGFGNEGWMKSGQPDEIAKTRGGKIVTRPRRDGRVDIELPAILVMRLLSGDATASEISEDFGQDLGAVLPNALREGREITEVSYVPGDTLERNEARIRFVLGKGRKPVIKP